MRAYKSTIPLKFSYLDFSYIKNASNKEFFEPVGETLMHIYDS